MNPRRRSDPGARDPGAPGVNRAIASGRSDSSGKAHFLYPGDEGYVEAIAAQRARIAAELDAVAAARENVIDNNRILGERGIIPSAHENVSGIVDNNLIVDNDHIIDNNLILGEGDIIPPAQASFSFNGQSSCFS